MSGWLTELEMNVIKQSIMNENADKNDQNSGNDDDDDDDDQNSGNDDDDDQIMAVMMMMVMVRLHKMNVRI